MPGDVVSGDARARPRQCSAESVVVEIVVIVDVHDPFIVGEFVVEIVVEFFVDRSFIFIFERVVRRLIVAALGADEVVVKVPLHSGITHETRVRRCRRTVENSRTLPRVLTDASAQSRRVSFG